MTRQEHAAGIIFVHPTNAKHLIAPASYQPAAHPGGDAIANLHFARIGDVWKHGPLVEVLTTMRPEVYAETHAGSASYPLTPSPERSYGVYRLLQAAAAALDVDRSPYLDLLRRHANTREPVFPGSPALAMQVLGDSARYLFCDTDPASVSSIQGWAATHAIQGVQTVAGDGVKAVRARVMSLDRTAAGRALVFLDPYEPFEVIDELGISAVGFLAELATSGLAALLWYGFDHASRPTTHAQLRAVTDAAGVAAHDADGFQGGFGHARMLPRTQGRGVEVHAHQPAADEAAVGREPWISQVRWHDLVGAVCLGAPFGAAQRAGVGRLGQVRADPYALEFLGNEPPAGRGLQREAGLLWVELVDPGAQLQAGGGAELPAAGLAGRGVEVVVGDLPAVDVEPSYDGHRDLLWLPLCDPIRPACRIRAEGSRSHAIY
jgi:23S rRNA A2030 N6-methylase RlmJ